MLEIPIIVFGALLALYVVVKSADELIHYSIAVAEQLRVPAFLVGVLIVGVGTSSPEALISAFAGLDGNANLSAGNAAGSNIVNTALLSLTLLIYPLLHKSRQAKVILSLLLGVHLLIFLLIDDSYFEFSDAMILIAIGGSYVVGMILVSARQSQNAEAFDAMSEHHEDQPVAVLGVLIVAALALLVLSANYFVELAVIFCQKLGISDLVVGLTVVAIGTSLPELSASLQAARRGATDISLGNMLGSMTFNLTIVFSFATLSGDVRLDEQFFARDYYCLLASFTIICLLYFSGARPRALKTIAVTAIGLYLVYTLVLIYSQVPAAPLP